MTDYLSNNQKAWDYQATTDSPWSQPVSNHEIEQAKQGQWEVHLTPKALPSHWLDDIQDKSILCLASAGGQQAPILAAAGANVTVFDFSEKQLDKDRFVAQRNHLKLNAIQGDMRDLSIFSDASFDYVFHPISNLYIPDVNPVWSECYRVLKSNGRLLSSFFNPVVFIGDRNPNHLQTGIIKPCYTMPFREMDILTAEQLLEKESRQEALVFGHSLTDLIGGQCKAGFQMIDFYEDWQPNPRFVVDKYLPTFLATYSKKV